MEQPTEKNVNCNSSQFQSSALPHCLNATHTLQEVPKLAGKSLVKMAEKSADKMADAADNEIKESEKSTNGDSNDQKVRIHPKKYVIISIFNLF